MNKFDEGVSLRARSRQPGSPPLHQQIADELRRQIAQGALRQGDPLPSENDLIRQFGVSRGTVRQARAALRADGTIGGSQGRRLAVWAPRLTQPLSELVSFSAWARSLGKQPSGQLVAFGPEAAGPDAVSALGRQPGETVFRLLRVRFIDDEAVMVERTLFPHRIGKVLVGVDLNRGSIYDELARHGLVVASAQHLVNAVGASRTDAQLLRVAPRTALLRVERRAFSITGEPVEWSDDRYRGDRVNVGIENSTLGSGVTRRLA
jgi:GntR family transcriptional regulator